MKETGLLLNELDYFEMPGLNVLAYSNFYPEGHQGGVEIIQHGERVATNGELRLSPSPGQWQPIPEVGGGFLDEGASSKTVALRDRIVDRSVNEIRVPGRYPNPARERKGFNPIIYPKLDLAYTVRVRAGGGSFTITVDLEKPLPEEWVGRVGYSLELFPGDLYGKTYYMDDRPGIFPRQAGGPTWKNATGEAEAVPLAQGRKLVVAPESDLQRLTIESETGPMQLIDGSLKHNNGWFIVHSLVPVGAAKGAVQWRVSPNVIPGWIDPPVIHISQVGYHPKQRKVAYIQLDKLETTVPQAALEKIEPSGTHRTVMERQPALWGRYLRYQYTRLDFTEISEPGVYQVCYGGAVSPPFRIDADVYKRHVWQPTLEYFLPMQMCHMRINQKYRVWHGLCHMDDARMAPPRIDHFDGYGNSGEPPGPQRYHPLEHVAGFDIGGWHDAGDDDIRTDTQINTVIALALAYEEFHVDYDETLIDQSEHLVEIHQPDGKPDVLQQIEHGVRWLLNFYRRFGSLGSGVIVPTLRQYVLLGDPSIQTDNRPADDAVLKSEAARTEGLWYTKVANRFSQIYDPQESLGEIETVVPDLDDRLVFLQTNPARQILVAAGLALAARVLAGYEDALSAECLRTAEALWEGNHGFSDDAPGSAHAYGYRSNLGSMKLLALAELFLTTKKEKYRTELIGMGDALEKWFDVSGWAVGRALPLLDSRDFSAKAELAAQKSKSQMDKFMGETPFGCPLTHMESFGMMHYFLHKTWPNIFSIEPLFDGLNFLLGCRPGRTTSSLVSGVGSDTPVVAYGFNRADWSYIPGGSFCNAINLIRPDLAEDKVWPFFWQEREYMTNTPCMFLFTVIAADKILNA